MRIGTRITRPDDVKQWKADIYQISVYGSAIESIERVKQCAGACRDISAPYVIHPVGFSLLDPDALWTLKVIAGEVGEKLILHDERSPDGGRLSQDEADRYRNVAGELLSIAPLSFENANDTHDAPWFWENLADSITLDIGHVEAAGIDSVSFVQNLDHLLLSKIEYVHMHHNGALRNGLTDHHPLHAGCRELVALEELAGRKREIAVLLEINETDMIDDSMALLKDLRDRTS